MTIKNLTNRSAIIDRLVSILKAHDISRDSFQTDVYLYIAEDGTGSLSEFTNVGGNSWLDDDHITLYRIPASHHCIEDEFYTVSDLCEAAGVTAESVKSIIAAAANCDVDDVDDYDVRKYISGNYHDAVVDCYADGLVDCDFYDLAEAIVESAESEQDIRDRFTY